MQSVCVACHRVGRWQATWWQVGYGTESRAVAWAGSIVQGAKNRTADQGESTGQGTESRAAYWAGVGDQTDTRVSSGA